MKRKQEPDISQVGIHEAWEIYWNACRLERSIQADKERYQGIMFPRRFANLARGSAAALRLAELARHEADRLAQAAASCVPDER